MTYGITFVSNHNLGGIQMNTFAVTEEYIAIGCVICEKYNGIVEIFSFTDGFPSIFQLEGNINKPQ